MKRVALMSACSRIAMMILFLLILMGCGSAGAQRHRMARYFPEYEGRNPWIAVESYSEQQGAEPRVPVLSQDNSNDNTETVQSTRRLKRGNRVRIFLRAIPEPEDLTDVIDDRGRINLPHIGKVKINDMTASQAETIIEDKYIEGGIYKNITVIIVAQQDDFFVRGEVMRPGKYGLTGEMTLIQALSQAGGKTDFASSKVRILREDQTLDFDLKRIEKGDQENPTIEPGDVIRVIRSGWLSL